MLKAKVDVAEKNTKNAEKLIQKLKEKLTAKVLKYDKLKLDLDAVEAQLIDLNRQLEAYGIKPN